MLSIYPHLTKIRTNLKKLTFLAAPVAFLVTHQAAALSPIEYQGTLSAQVENFRGYDFSKKYQVQIRYNIIPAVTGKAVVLEETRCLADDPKSNECYLRSNLQTFCVTQLDLKLGDVQWEILDTDPDSNKSVLSQSLWQPRVSRAYKKGSSPCQSLSLDGMKVNGISSGDARFDSPLQPGVRTRIQLSTKENDGPRAFLVNRGNNFYGIEKISAPPRIKATWSYDLVTRGTPGKSWNDQGEFTLSIPVDED